MDYLRKQFDQFGRDVQGIPESKAYQQLKRSLEEWAREMERAEEDDPPKDRARMAAPHPQGARRAERAA